MKAIITITECSSMPGRFQYSFQRGKKVLKGRDAGNDPAAAAAKAIDLSMGYGAAGYVIFGPQKVLDHLPRELRAKAKNA
jgi:hypothetical protein